MTTTDRPLAGRVALVAGATRGAGRGIAIELAAAGATVYCSGRSTGSQRSEMDRPETIEETAELAIAEGGGEAIAAQVDHLVPAQVRELVARIEREQGRLDVLVNSVWGADWLTGWDVPLWEHDLERGLRILRLAIDTHAITSHAALPLMIREPGALVVEMNDGPADYNATNYRIPYFYDLVKFAVPRLAFAQAHDLRPHGGTALSLSPGWLRSEAMLDHYGVREENWRDALATVPHFCISETPRFVGRAVAALAADPERARWNAASLDAGRLAPVYGFTDLDGSRPDAWRYVVEVQDAGRPADATGYR